ncbi:MAG: lasso peptide biosynthesis PqqD family chaperone [Bacteroidales bacterium]|nr:lasso peptide biosynthesis PqqD family chaperone [Bacteroidales bacterium]
MGEKGKGLKIAGSTVLQRRQNQLFSEIDGEVVMLSVENSEYYGMDTVGSRIWQLLENPLSFKSLVDALLEEYEVTEEQCTANTHTFIEQLAEKGLVEINSPNLPK